MSHQMTFFLTIVGLSLTILGGFAAHYYRKSRITSQNTWEHLLARLAAVNRANIQQVAFDAIDPSGKPRTDDAAKELKPDEIWRLVGGLKGLEVLEQNSLVLIDMAFYLQRWYPEALVTAEELRLKAREIEWHVSRLKAAARNEALESWFANYAQNTVAAYYVMTRRVLSLYEAGGLPMLADVQRAL